VIEEKERNVRFCCQQDPIALSLASSFIKLASYRVVRAFICALSAVSVIALGIGALSLSSSLFETFLLRSVSPSSLQGLW
jgi:hypothetical protein